MCAQIIVQILSLFTPDHQVLEAPGSHGSLSAGVSGGEFLLVDGELVDELDVLETKALKNKKARCCRRVVGW